MDKNKRLYTKDSIESLSPLAFTRLRPQVYCGDTTYSTQLLIEVVSNSVDEFRNGFGDTIEVYMYSDGSFKVRDYGQGFLVNSLREDGKTVLEAAFSVLNTSGKYREDGTYEGTSLGSYGIGCKIVNFLSHWLDVTTYRGGEMESIRFEEGVFTKREVDESHQLPGTCVEWLPSEEFFTNIGIDEKAIDKLFTAISCLCPGLTIILRKMDDSINPLVEEKFYSSKRGLNDLIDQAVKDKEILKNRFLINFSDNKYKLDLVMSYSSSYSSTIVSYVNAGLTESGPHITQIKTLITKEMNKFFREKGWIKEKEDNLSGEDCQEGMYLVFNITAPNIAYDAQVKTRVTKIDMKPFTQVLAEELQYWMAANEKDIKIIADKALNARKAREAAKKARETARSSKTKKSKREFLDLPTKLVDAWSKKERAKCELYIVEGDSAANGLVQTRNSEFQAIFPVRGKIISALKNTAEKIFANQEINNFIKAIGLELDGKTHKLIYDINRLRYGKIIAAADADPDGKSIKNLLYTAIWWLCPELIIQGHVYAALPPLYRITTKKNEYIFLKGDTELEEYKNNNPGKKYIITRNKGLGEQDKEELEESILNQKTRNIVQITVEDMQKANEMFEMLMGVSVPARRQYLLEHSEEARG